MHPCIGVTLSGDDTQSSNFHALAGAASAREAQTVRDRYLGRKNSVVAAWMQLIASAPPDQKKNIGRYANELKQAVEHGVLKTGIMYECIQQGVDYVLAGSIRDDGPLPDTIMDLRAAQDRYAAVLEVRTASRPA